MSRCCAQRRLIRCGVEDGFDGVGLVHAAAPETTSVLSATERSASEFRRSQHECPVFNLRRDAPVNEK